MPDIFDQVAAPSASGSGDIFDQVGSTPDTSAAPVAPPKDTVGDLFKGQTQRMSNAPIQPGFPTQRPLSFGKPSTQSPADTALEQVNGPDLALRSNAAAPKTVGEQAAAIKAGSSLAPQQRAPLSTGASRPTLAETQANSPDAKLNRGIATEQADEAAGQGAVGKAAIDTGKDIYEGATKTVGQTGEDFDRKKFVQGITQLVSGGSKVAVTLSAPELMELGIAADAGDVAAQGAIIKMLAAAEAGNIASDVSGKAADKLNLSPETKDLLQTAAFFLPTLAGVIAGKAGGKAGIGVDGQGNPGMGASMGGAKVGAVGTPEAIDIRAQVGGTRVGVKIPRGGAPAPAPPDPANILAAQQTEAATNAIVRANTKAQQAATMAAGGPPPPKPGPALPDSLKEGVITPETVSNIAQLIHGAPKRLGNLIMEAHGKLTEYIKGKGRIIGPDGKLQIAETPQQAAKLAQNIINDEVDRHAAATEEGAQQQAAVDQRNETPAAAPKSTTGGSKAPASDGEATPDDQLYQRAKTIIEGTTPKPGQNIVNVISRNLGVGAGSAHALVDRYKKEKAEANLTTVGSKAEPVVEEARATVDAQLEALKKGDTNVVMLPEGSRYIPKLPDGMKMMSVTGDAPGAGKYIYDPTKIRAATIKAAAKAGTHGDLLGHIQTKEELAADPNKPTVVVQAKNSDGTVIQDSEVHPELAHKQVEAMQERHPDAHVSVAPTHEVIQDRVDAAAKEEPEGDVFDEVARTDEPEEEAANEYLAARNVQGKPIEILSKAESAPAKEVDKSTKEEKLANESTEQGAAVGTSSNQGAAPAAASENRRVNEKRRKAISEMTPEEMKKELLTSPTVDLPNRRAFDEAQATAPATAVAMSDADGLKALNDKFGYEAGNKLLQAKAEAIAAAGLDAYHEKGDEFLYRGDSKEEIAKKLDAAREILRDRIIEVTKTDGTVLQFKGADFSFGTGEDLNAAESGLKEHKADREARGERARGELRGIAEVGPGNGEVGKSAASEVTPTKFEHGSTQATIPEDSDAGKALEKMRQAIPDADLDAKGRDVGESHITVRYGLTDEKITPKLRKFIEGLTPFDAHLGKTDAFPPSTYSDGASAVYAKIEAPELTRINDEIGKHGTFKKSDFSSYIPHTTVAYVKPEAADKYKGMTEAEGKTFSVDHIDVSDRNGDVTSIKMLGGASNEVAKPAVTPIAKGDTVTFKDRSGTERTGTVAHSGDRLTRIKSEGKEYTVGTKSVAKAEDSTTPTSDTSGRRVVSAPAKGAAMKLTQDWGVEEINGYSDNPQREEGNQVKDAFLKESKKYLTEVQKELRAAGFTDALNHKDKPIPVTINESGPATSGDVTLRMNPPEGGRSGIYVHIGAGHVHGVPVTSSGMSIMYRKTDTKTGDTFGTRGVNQWAKTDLTAAELAEVLIKEATGLTRENLAKLNGKEAAPEPAKEVAKPEAAPRQYQAEVARYAGDPETRLEKVEAENRRQAESLLQEKFPGQRIGSAERIEVATTPPEEENNPNELGDDQAGGRREATDTGGADRAPVAAGEAEAPQEFEGSREAEAADTGDGVAVHPDAEPVSGGGAEPGSGRGSDTGLDSSPGRVTVEKATKALAKTTKLNRNWYSHPDTWNPPSGTVGRLDANLAALRILRDVQKSPRKVTPEEQAKLANYVGWGALQHAFDPWGAPYDQRERFQTANRELQQLLSSDELAAARRSTQNAHYTSPELVRYMWDLMKRFGFTGGNVIEPSMGSGNFFGMMPKAMRNNVTAIGNEMEPITAGIAKLLYPDATIFNKDFVQLVLPDNSLDLAISNVPFGLDVYDPKYPKLNAKVHDYFFVKSLDKIRPGGIVAFITSTGTMDKSASTLRDIMASKADLVGAIRLPSGAFSKNAGTEVTTDLIILQKRAMGEKASGPAWEKAVNITVPGRYEGTTQEVRLNEYFHEHPEMMLGTPGVSTMYGRDGGFALYPHEDQSITDLLEKAKAKLPKGIMREDVKATGVDQASTPAVFAKDNQLEGQYVLDDKGNLRQVVDGKLKSPEVVEGADGSKSVAKIARIKDMIGLRDHLNDLLGRMMSEPDDEDGNHSVSKQRERLKSAYDKFVKKNGLINAPANNVFQDDPHYPRLLALENYDRAKRIGTPSDILSKRTIFPRQPLTTVSPDTEDALYQVLAERGYADVGFLAKLQGKEVQEVVKNLTDKGLVYRNPASGEYEMKEKYLSGYVRDKLDDARRAVAQGMKEYEPNVAALEKAVPADITIKDIEVKLGATWIPLPAFSDFISDTFKVSGARVSYEGGSWSVSSFPKTAEVMSEYGTTHVPADELLSLSLNQKEAQVTYRDSDGKTHVNKEATLLAQQKQQAVRDAFNAWSSSSEKWAAKLEKAYNYAYNNLVIPDYDGSHLTFPGMNASVELRKHQRDAIWRIIQDGRALLAHVVGAGKTFEVIGSIMEGRRIGTFRKPMVAVPNHLVGQWAKDFYKLYPGSSILVPTPNDFDAKNRQRLMAKIATGDYDAVIMAHSQFNLMDISAERQEKTLNNMMEELEETIRAMKAAFRKSGGGRSEERSVKQMEKSKEALRTRIAKLKDLKADKVINFDDTGVDALFVDEAHAYKNLAFYTKMSRIAGLSQGDAKRAIRMKMKTDYLLETNNNRGVIFATGTPIQNTMAEQYSMTKYVAPDVLEKAGIKFFDDWAANFGSVRTLNEVSADGRTFKAKQKFSRFSNVPELMSMFRSFTDIKTAKMLNLPTPKLEGGKPEANYIEPSTELNAFVESLMKRADRVKTVDPKIDNMLKIVGDGRKAALDMRLVNPNAKDDPKSKINQVVDDVYAEWKAGNAQKLTQLVFLDMYRALDYEVSYDDAGKATISGKPTTRINLYDDMKAKWVKSGIPADHIAIMYDYDTDAKKSALFEKVNAGDVRILMGSTEKMGAGMNVQERLKVLHHVDLPWRPGDLAQRTGRIERQGNKNEEVKVKYWLTQKSFDTFMLQGLENKAKFIEQLMSGEFKGRSMEDIDSTVSMNLQDMKVATSGNPDIKLKYDLMAEENTLETLYRGFRSQMQDNKYRASSLRSSAAKDAGKVVAMKKALARYEEAKGEKGEGFTMELDGLTFTDRKIAFAHVDKMEVPPYNFHMQMNGIGISVKTKPDKGEKPTLEYTSEFETWASVPPELTMPSLFRSIESTLRQIPKQIESLEESIAREREKAEKLDELATKGEFKDAARLEEVRKQLKDVDVRLGIGKKELKDEAPDALLEADEPDDEDNGGDEGDGEDNKPTKKSSGPTLRASVFGLDILAEFMAKQGVKLWESDIAPHLGTTAQAAKAAAKQVSNLLYPRIGANQDALDSIMRAKGEREKARFTLERIEGGLEKFFDKMPTEARFAFIDRYKLGVGQLDPKLQLIEDIMRSIDTDTFRRAQAYKPSMTAKDDHYRVLWKVIPDPSGTHGNTVAKGKVGQGRRPFEGDKGFMKRSTLETISEGINYGGVPVSTNPWKMFTLAQASMMQYITAQDHWKDLKRLGLRKFVKPGTPKPDGWVKLDDRIAKAFFPASSGEGMVQAGEWYLEPGAGRILNNYLSRDLIRENEVGKALMMAKNLATSIELGASPFHFIFETLEAMGSQFGLGAQRLWNNGLRLGQGSEATRGLKEMATSIAAPVLMARAGGSLAQAGSNPTNFAKTKRGAEFLKQYPDAIQLLDELFTGGYQWGMNPDYKFDPQKSLTAAWADKNYGGAMLRLVPWVPHAIMAPLFEHYIPRLKLGFALAQYSQQIAENGKALANGDTTRAKIAREVIDTAENRFGEMNFSNLFWDNTFKSVAQFLFRSVTWKLGNWRGLTSAVGKEAFHAFEDPIKAMIEDAKAGKKQRPAGEYIPKLGMNQAWLIGMVAVASTIGTILAKLLSDKYPSEWAKDGGSLLLETMHPRTGRVNAKTGKPERMSLMTGLKDFEHFYRHPKEYARGSLSDTAGKMIDLSTNRDFFGNYVYDPNAPLYQQAAEAVKYAMPKPIALSSVTSKSGAQDTQSKVLKFLGANVTSRELDLTPAESRMQQIMRDRQTPLTPQQVKDRDAKHDLVKPATPAQLHRQLRAGKVEWVQREFAKMSYADAREVYYKLANDRERHILKDAFDKKRMRAIRKDPSGVRQIDGRQDE